jgi:hypothetical protein
MMKRRIQSPESRIQNTEPKRGLGFILNSEFFMTKTRIQKSESRIQNTEPKRGLCFILNSEFSNSEFSFGGPHGR